MIHSVEELPRGIRERLDEFETKSDRIRFLDDAGYARADIARVLKIRYQHARNVLEADSRKVEEMSTGKVKEDTPGDTATVWLEVSRDGRVVLPREMLTALGLTGGGKVAARVEDGVLMAEASDRALKRIQEQLRPLKRPGVSEVDEFLKERRALWGEE